MHRRQTQRTEAVELNILQILKLLVRGWWLIMLSAVLFAAVAYGASKHLITPQYEASTLFYVNNNAFHEDNRLSGSDLEVAKSLVDTYIVILETRDTLSEVIDTAGVELTPRQVSRMITARAVEKTELFRVVVTGEDPEEVGRIAIAIGQVLPQRIRNIMEGTFSSLAQEASIPDRPAYPRVTENIIIGFLFGFVFACTVLLLRAMFDLTIRKASNAEECGCPVLAQLPAVPEKKLKGKLRERRLPPDTEEACRLLWTKLEYAFADVPEGRVISLSSALTGEGKSTTAVTMACTMAKLNRKVLLVDCDMRRPTVCEKLQLNREPGLSAYLSHQAPVEAVVQECLVEDVSFDVICAGREAPNPGELLNSAGMKEFVEQMRQRYDYILLDMPPVGEVADALVTADYTHGALLVARVGVCDGRKLKNAVSQFAAVNCRVLGIVLNCVKKTGG